MQTTATERGQTSIPAPIRRRYGLKSRSKLIWVDLGGSVSVIPVADDPMGTVRGLFKEKGLRKLLLEERRRERKGRV